MSWTATIGLEVHVQLATATKIFCACPVEFGSEPNRNTCPVCLGLPGALPVLNREVFQLGLKAVLALNGRPSALVKFDRKNYFYPDLPKGYQISQYDHPLGKGGFVEIERQKGPKKISLNRLHLEEDAGKLMHDLSPNASVVDLNRAGTPLLEIVSEPDLESPEEAYSYLVALKAILKSTGVSECDMEKGQLRCDANVSVRKATADPLGKKVEIKNLNSFKAVKAAIQYEIRRQSQALEGGGKIAQETRLWNEADQKTVPMRSKEEAHDYRYFPEPDLVPFTVTEAEIRQAQSAIPELPAQKAQRFAADYGLTSYDAGILTQDKDLAGFFEECASQYQGYKTIANWITGPLSAWMNEHPLSSIRGECSPASLVALIRLVEEGRLSLQAARDRVLAQMLTQKRHPKDIMKELGLEQVSEDGALNQWISEAIRDHAKVVGDFKSGKESAAMFLVGQVMRKSGGKANPSRVKELLLEKLKQSP